MALNSMIFSVSNTGIGILTVNFFILFALVSPLKIKLNSKLTRNIYLWSNILTASFLMWSTSSPHYVLVMPIFIVIASLIVSTRTFFVISTYCLLSMLAFGIMKANHWGTISLNQSFGYWQMIDVFIILCSAIYTAWQASTDMEYALKNLNREIRKVTESRSKIEGLVHYDSLTGLANKSYCEEQYSEIFESTNLDSEQISVFFLDLDNFKSINDYYNHSVGDKLLVTVSKRLKGLINDEDIACRLSGDEFILIIHRPKRYNTQVFASRILKEISKPININSSLLDTTASIGVAVATKQDCNFNEIRKKADLAMYEAKQSGKNSIHTYNDEMYQQSLNKITIVKGLKEALKNNGLEVYLQPKVDISTGKINSAEALIRWTDKNINDISPAEFIPLIESTELICEIGEWVIHNACQLCKKLHDNGYKDISIAVNISSSQFAHGNLEEIIKRELELSQLPARFLELELTEYAIFHDNDTVLEQLKCLKKLGIILSIDDFGTGYSNLEYLTKFNVDLLKIDQSFIKGIQNSTENLAIVTAIIKMAKTLGLKVVAEGVETQNQWDALKKLDCNYGQGFLWSKALSPNNFITYLDKEHSDNPLTSLQTQTKELSA